ncbi:hypothetical protein [Streptomyces sp. NPDC014685]|uniref:hypothetical protein n=1 Tax=Streptomyces sp. NPDC014685 TaxID=3364881 RepID=UPI0036FAA470
MNTFELAAVGAPVRVVRDECGGLVAQLPFFRTLAVPVAAGRSLPLDHRLVLLRSCRVHRPSSAYRKQEEQP